MKFELKIQICVNFMEIKYKQYNKFMNCAIVSRSWYNIEKWLQIFSIDKQNGTFFKKIC